MPSATTAGMRTTLIHGYDHVDLDVVWDTVEQEVFSLLSYVEPLLPPEENRASTPESD